MEPLKTYYHVNIIDILGLAPLALEAKKKILEEAVNLVHLRVFNNVLDIIPEEKKPTLKLHFQNNDFGGFFKLLHNSNIDFESEVQKEVENLKGELMTLIG